MNILMGEDGYHQFLPYLNDVCDDVQHTRWVSYPVVIIVWALCGLFLFRSKVHSTLKMEEQII